MRKSKKSLLFAFLAVVLTGHVLIGTIFTGGALPLFGLSNGAPIDMELTQANLPTITGNEGTLQYNQDVTINYTNVSAQDGYHAVLGKGGSIYKVEPTYGMTSITATFEGSLQFECGFEADYETQEVVYMSTLTSGELQVVEGNYWKIVALEDTKITDLSITYSCTKPSTPSISTVTNLITIPNVTQFADIVKIEETIYLKLQLNYDVTLGRITAEDLKVQGDLATELFTCDWIETTSSNSFNAYFNVSKHHETLLGTAAQKIIYLHLLVNDTRFTSTGNVLTSSNHMYNKTYSVEGNKAVTVGLRNSAIDGSTTNTKLAWLILENKNEHDFLTNDTEDPSVKLNKDNPFSVMNGGTTDCGTYGAENGLWRYGNTNNRTFTTTVYSNVDTEATFAISTGGRYEKMFSFNKIDDYNPYIETLTVNGSTEGVVGLDTVTTFYKQNQEYRPNPWHYNFKCPLATVQLKQGLNKVTFKISQTYSTGTTSAQNDLNIHGVSFNCVNPEARLNLHQVYDINNSPDYPTGDTSLTTEFGSHNPLLPTNGGNITGTPTFEAWNFKYEAGGYRYGGLLGYDVTFVLNAEEAGTVDLSFVVSGSSRNFCADKTGFNSESNQISLSYLRVNGDDSKATLSKTVTNLSAWSTFKEAPVGTLQLEKGVNVITFRFQGSSNSTKINFKGITLAGLTDVTLGA